MDILKARVFLNKKFLETNWRYAFLSGASLTAPVDWFPDTIKFYQRRFNIFTIRSFRVMSLVFLLILAYKWLVLISAKKNQF